MQRNKRLILPLTVGHAAINKPPMKVISSADLEIDVELQGKMLQSLICQSSARIITRVKYEGHRVEAECNEAGKGGQTVQLVHLNEGSRNNSSVHISAPPFRGTFRKANDQLQLLITKQITTFHLFPVAKGRFVKNEVLSRVMAERGEEWGPLSMDTSQRIMLEPQGTTFPVIGLWIASEHTDSDPNTLIRFLTHITAPSPKNCIFSAQGRNFIYLVRVGGGRNTPELFLAEWKSQGQSQTYFHLSKQEVFTRAVVRVSSNQTTALEFTLRSDQKVPEPLMNITCSPIKFPSSPSPSPQATRSSLPDSPRFKLDHSALLEQECASLRRLTREQQIEIDDLRAEVLRLSGELRHYRRQRHHCDSQDLSLASPRASPNGGRRLTRSDLNYDQPSIANEECHMQSKEARVLEAWEQFQIEEPAA